MNPSEVSPAMTAEENECDLGESTMWCYTHSRWIEECELDRLPASPVADPDTTCSHCGRDMNKRPWETCSHGGTCFSITEFNERRQLLKLDVEKMLDGLKQPNNGFLSPEEANTVVCHHCDFKYDSRNATTGCPMCQTMGMGKWASPVAEGESQMVTPDGRDWQHAFKNFHSNLCKRFGYMHDEVDWYRDLVSLEEFIAAKAHIVEGHWIHTPTDPRPHWCGSCSCGAAWKTNEQVKGCPTL